MRTHVSLFKNVFILVACSGLFASCAHHTGADDRALESMRPVADGVTPLKDVKQPVLLRLKAVKGRTEKVTYSHRSTSKSYENGQLRHQKDDSIDFLSQAETLDAGDADDKGVSKFTQSLSVVKKDGNADLHDFAMPDLGEKNEVTADSLGHIYKVHAISSDNSTVDYPQNSIFFVPPMSIPEKPVSIGDTWTMQANWLSLEEMVPYQLDMVSILKGFWSCGAVNSPDHTKDTCAEIEISGDVGFQGTLAKTFQFHSSWHGRIFFAMKAGTVVWSRVDSDERLVAEKVRRDVDSCLEAVLVEPTNEAMPNMQGSRCVPIKKTETQLAP